MSSISSFDIISVVVLLCLGKAKSKGCLPDPEILSYIPAFAAEASAGNPNGIKTLLANGFIIFFINGNPVFNHGPRSLTRNPPDCVILDN